MKAACRKGAYFSAEMVHIFLLGVTDNRREWVNLVKGRGVVLVLP